MNRIVYITVCVAVVLQLMLIAVGCSSQRAALNGEDVMFARRAMDADVVSAVDSLLSLAYRDDQALLDTVASMERYLTERNAGADWEVSGLIDDMLLTNASLGLPSAVVRFEPERDKLTPTSYRQIEALARIIRGVDDMSEYYIIGSYDNPSESLKNRKKLATLRCRRVSRVLVEQFGVEPRRLRILPDGGCAEVGVQNGRGIVLVVIRCPETSDVVDRWMSGVD